MSTRQYCLALSCVVALSGQASAELIHFNGNDALARVAYIPPGDPNHRTYSHFWADVSLTMDDDTGLLNLYKVDVYNRERTAIGYSLPPQTLQLSPISIGWRLDPYQYEGLPWRVSFMWNDGQWTMAFLTTHQNSGIPFTAEMLSQDFPGLTAFDFQGVTVIAPEPAALVLCLLLLPVGYAVRRWLSVA